MKRIIQFTVNRPITLTMIICAILLLGYIAFQKLTIELLPDLNNPRIYIQLEKGEEPPEEIEQQYVISLESLVSRLKQVKQVSSISRIGSAQITIEYSWEADMDEALLDLQRTVTDFSQNIDIDDISITRHDPNADPVLILTLSHPEISDMNEIRKVAENYIQNDLIRIEGIAIVELLGDEEQEIVISTNTKLLDAYQLTASEISERIQSFNQSISAGSVTELGQKYIIKGVSQFKSLNELEDLIVDYRYPETASATEMNNTSLEERIPIYLKNVANIEIRNTDPQNLVRVDQHRSIGLVIYKESKHNTIDAIDAVLDRIDQIKQSLPGYDIEIIKNQANFIQMAIREVEQTALLGIILAVIILYMFLRRLGVTLIISIAIPISIITTFNLMYFNNLSINIMTLGGLALGAGMLVDNAIVVMENIIRIIDGGENLQTSAIQGTSEVAGAITASTLTTIIVFLPIIYIQGAAAELFKDQALTVAFSLLSSLLVAIFLIPMLATKFLGKRKVSPSRTVNFPVYKSILTHILARKYLVLAIALIIILVTLFLIPFVGSEFIPGVAQDEFDINIELTAGTSLERTQKTIENIETILQTELDTEIKTIYSQIGALNTLYSQTNQTEYSDDNTAVMKVILNSDHQYSLNKIMRTVTHIMDNLPGLDYTIVNEQSEIQTIVKSEAAPIVIEFSGEDLEILDEITVNFSQKLKSEISDIGFIETSFDVGRPQIDIEIDRRMLALNDLSLSTAINQLQDHLSGRDAGEWDDQGELKPISIRFPDIGLKELENFQIKSGERNYSLNEIAYLHKNTAPSEIFRKNQNRVGKISAQIISDRPFNKIINDIEHLLQQYELPDRYNFAISGDEKQRRESFASLKFALLLSIILVYMVMASQFESLKHPFTILLSIPFAGVGVIILYLLIGKPLNIMSYIGIIMLGGIAVNDSIILVDRIIQLKNEGLDRVSAIIEAGQQRIRPIIMTSITTILALLPLTFGYGEGAALRSPMAYAVIGGLITSTLLTLVVIPCVFLVIDSINFRRSRY